MAYDEEFADRVRELLVLEPDVLEKRMFGGVAFLIGGHIAVAVSSAGGLLMRCEHEDTEATLALPHVEPFVMRGKPMRGWVRVGEEAVDEDRELKSWVASGVGYARSLTPS